jgi:predicted AlkP superfamily phosphohydrolase/phosphomutase
MTENNPAVPLVIVGFDSGDPRLLCRWAQEGYLPTLSSLMQRGCWAETCGAELLLEHGVWLSIFSGIRRDRHGFYYFRQLVPGSYDLRLVHGPETGTQPFWAAWPHGPFRMVVVDVPDAPLVPGLPGAQILNWAIHRGYVSNAPCDQPRSEPGSLLGEITRRFGPPVQIIEKPDATPAQSRGMRSRLLNRVEKKGALCRYLIERERPGIVVISFGESHTAGHQFWRYCGDVAGHCLEDGHELGSALRDVYQAIDRELGLLLSSMPSPSNVVVLSSIGLADHYPTGQLMESFCRELGYQAPSQPGTRSANPAALVRRMIPRPLRLALSRHLSRETREQLLAQQFRTGTDWTQTTAFAIPSIYAGFLRVNLRGREPGGIVEPGAAYEAMLERLESDLLQLIDPQTGQPAIEKVCRVNQLYPCQYPSVLPDLIVHWRPSTRFLERVVHPKRELRQKKPEFFRESEHMFHGFFAAAGPGIRGRGRLADIEVPDLAPTFLRLLNQEKRAYMTGKVVEALTE